MERNRDMAKRKWKNEFAGVGAMLQFIGLLCLVLYPIGTVIGVVLFIVGSCKSQKQVCGDCGNRILNTTLICPTCKAAIEE